MKFGLSMTALILALALTGCGQKIRTPWSKKPEADNPTSIDGPGGRPRTTAPKVPYVRDNRIPVETFLVGGAIPERLKTTALTVNFRSNIAEAVFECQSTGDADYAPCLGATYEFLALAHGQVGDLKVRARAPDGQVDTSPVTVTFIVDMIAGTAPGDASTGAPPADPVDPGNLPEPGTPPTGDDENPLEERSLQLGSFFAVAVPYDQQVTSYSTNKTYNFRIRLMRLIGEHAGSAYQGVGCGRDYERVVAGPSDTSYCDGTPTRAQLMADYPRPLPFNHVELVRGTGPTTDEKILIAAYDAEPDPVEQKLGINGTCAGSISRGKTSVPVIADFFGEDPSRAIVSWCQVRDRQGAWWWVGAFTARLGTAKDAPRISVIYTVSNDLGIVSSPQFIGRIGRLIPTLIVPLAPVPHT